MVRLSFNQEGAIMIYTNAIIEKHQTIYEAGNHRLVIDDFKATRFDGVLKNGYSVIGNTAEDAYKKLLNTYNMRRGELCN